MSEDYGINVGDHVFWRRKTSGESTPSSNWKEGYVVGLQNGKVKFGEYIGDMFGNKWIDMDSLEIETII